MKIREISQQEYHIGIINSIKQKHKNLRQDSKSATFALTYGGTFKALMEECGIATEEEAKRIYNTYHELYKVADEYVNTRLDRACKDGYVTCAFGLRLRTPVLKESILNTNKTSARAAKDAKTAGNALGQSWGLLNCRAVCEVMEQVWNSPYKYDILPVAQIHDASYYIVRDNLDAICYLNKILGKAMKWQDASDIAHDKVHLGGELDLFYPDWAHPVTIPNDISKDDLIKLLQLEKKNRG